jgi:enterochelin esterase-like enzyme
MTSLRRPVPRRAFLLGATGVVAGLGAAAAGVDAGVLPGKHRVAELFAGPPPPLPDAAAGPTVSGSFASRAMGGARTGWSIAYPPGHRPGQRLPVLVVLHARGGDHTSAFSPHLGLDRYLATLPSPQFAIASVDGGDHSYWHPRQAGDAAELVTGEFVPLLAEHGLDTTRIGLFGWSMGGYGALYLASRLGPSRVTVAVASSPAIWRTDTEYAAGAFDSPADWTAHTIWGQQAALVGIALRVDCGAQDGFASATRVVRAGLRPTPAGGIESGDHDLSYWRGQAPAQLAFVAAHL